MNLSKTLLMALLVVLGGLYVWKFESEPIKTPEEESEEAAAQPVFPGLTVEQISKVQVDYPGGSYGFQRTSAPEAQHLREQMWTMLEPAGAETDYHNVQDVVQTVVEMQVRNVILPDEQESGEDPYGLAKPTLTLKVEAGETQHELRFGKQHAFSGRRYAQRPEDDRVFIVEESAYGAFVKTRDELRNRSPLSFNIEEIETIDVERAELPPLHFVREGGRWLGIDGERRIELDGELVERSLRNISRLTVAEFIDNPGEDLTRYGLAEPKLKLVLGRGPGEKTDTILIGEKKEGEAAAKAPGRGELFVKAISSPVVYGFEKRFYSDLLQPLDHFRGKQPFAEVSTTGVERVQIEGNGGAFTLGRKSEGEAHWQIAMADGTVKSADKSRVEGFIEAIKNLEVISYPGGIASENRTEAPALQIVLATPTTSNGEAGKEYRLQFGPEVGAASDTAQGPGYQEAPRHGMVTVSGAEIPVVLSASSWRDLNQSAEYFVGP